MANIRERLGAFLASLMMSSAVASVAVAAPASTVRERTGPEPLVLQPHEKVGRHGGTLRTALRGNADHNSILRIVGVHGLVRWNLDMTEILPNAAKRWTVNASSTEFTFELRHGMRWSDGKPFTADDVVFAMNDLVLNPAFNPVPPPRYTAGGKPARVEKLDGNRVRFTFAAPYLRFLNELATPLGQHPALYQRAYCSQFHPRYVPKESVEAKVRAGKMKDWADLMRQRCGDVELSARWANLDRPTLDPWVVTEPYGGGVTRVAMRRNPYFWQVDTAGQQLPYIDELQFIIISDIETILLTTIAGGLDLQVRHINLLSNKPVLAKNREKAGLAFLELQSTLASAMGIYFNLSHKDAALRALFNQKNFRIAVSHAIDREEILESVLFGAGEAFQVGPVPGHPFHNEQLGKQFLRYDVKQANALLDGLGLTRRDSRGFRLFPSGRRVFFTIDFPLNNPDYGDILNLVKRDLAAVGIDIGINPVERSLFYDRAARNDHDAAANLVPGGWEPMTDMRALVAENPLESRQSLEWQKWHESGGKRGQTPSVSMQKRFALLEQWRAAPNQAESDRLFRQILAEAADAFEVIGTVRPYTLPAVRKKALRNVPQKLINSWSVATPASAMPQQFFFE